MSTILEIPIPKLQNTVVFDPPLTDEEFERMSMANELVKLERTKEGKILVNPPAGANSSSGKYGTDLSAQGMVEGSESQRHRIRTRQRFLPPGRRDAGP